MPNAARYWRSKIRTGFSNRMETFKYDQYEKEWNGNNQLKFAGFLSLAQLTASRFWI